MSGPWVKCDLGVYNKQWIDMEISYDYDEYPVGAEDPPPRTTLNIKNGEYDSIQNDDMYTQVYHGDYRRYIDISNYSQICPFYSCCDVQLNCKICYYDNNYSFISGTSIMNQGKIVTKPNNAVYCRIDLMGRDLNYYYDPETGDRRPDMLYHDYSGVLGRIVQYPKGNNTTNWVECSSGNGFGGDFSQVFNGLLIDNGSITTTDFIKNNGYFITGDATVGNNNNNECYDRNKNPTFSFHGYKHPSLDPKDSGAIKYFYGNVSWSDHSCYYVKLVINSKYTKILIPDF